MTFRPMQDRLLVRRLPPDERSEGGLHLSADYAEPNRHCEVVAVGPGRQGRKATAPHPCTTAPGDHVLLSRGAGTKIPPGLAIFLGLDLAHEHLVVRETDLLGYWPAG